MKKQLLEDFGDSQSSLSSAPVRRHAPAAVPAAVPPSAAPSGHGTRARAGVWRSRAPAVEPAFAAPRPVVSPIPEPPPVPEPPPLRPEPTLGAPDIAPEIASFSSRQPDWSAPLDAETIPWTERWGRKALGWSLALAGVVAIAGTGMWMVRETKVESTLAIVADHTPAPGAPAAPAVAAVPAPEPVQEEPPPLRMLPPEAPEAPAAAAIAAPPPEAAAVEPALAATAVVAAAAPAIAASPAKTAAAHAPVKKKPVAKRAPERKLAAAPAKPRKPAVKQAAKSKDPSGRVLARALADAQRSRQESLARPSTAPDPAAAQPAASGNLSETLRLCRAAGYHANACMKRACEATRFGLVCRG